MPPDLDSLNKRFYESQTVADSYASKNFVFPEEQAFLDAYSSQALVEKCVLDIGIGAGRTTRFLVPLAKYYVGVDYSPDMISAARGRFPDVSLHVRDARDLSAYSDGEFDCVLFSFNGIDCLSPEGRSAAMSETWRVLKPGGWFAFSTHNRSRKSPGPFSLCNLSFSKNPVHLWSHIIRYLRGITNWLRTRSLAMENEAFAIRHDSGNLFQAPMYYIDKSQQVAQLARAGFETISIYNRNGEMTTADIPDKSSSWLFFVGCKIDRHKAGNS